MWPRALLFCSLFCATVCALPSAEKRAITPPTDDPFYVPPDGFEDTAPGTILRHRPVPFPIVDLAHILNLDASHQMLYRTTDSFGNAIATVTTLLVPYNADNSKLLSYQVAEDAAWMNCAPSYALQLSSILGGLGGSIVPRAELLLMEAVLQQGWLVSTPDFEGPDAAFLANNLAGHAVLDGIRAVHASSDFTGVAPDPGTVMWGYSGGSLATGFATELQPSYAPDLRIAGAALGGTVPNIMGAVPLTNESPNTGLVPPGVLGLSHEYPEVRNALSDILVPEKRETFMQAEQQCLVANILQFYGDNIFSYFENPDFIFSFDSITSANSMGHHAPQIPLYIYKGAHDEVSAIGETNDLVQYYCDGGSSVTYTKDLTATHGSMAILGAPGALIYLKDRLDGFDPGSGCSVDTVISSLLNPATSAVLTEALIKELLSLLGKSVGPILIG